MKKFFVTLVIFILIGAGCFFAGWVQLPVPHGSYGVLKSKTHGLYKDVIKDGRLVWLWYRLIPADTDITVFNIKPQNISVNASGTLQQSDAYSSFVGLKASFVWQVSGDASFSINPDTLPQLTERFVINDQAALDSYTAKLCSELKPFINQRLSYYCEQRDVIEQINSSGAYKNLEADVCAAFPYINNFSCSLAVKQFPDYELYESAKSMYQDYIAHQRGILNREVTSNAANRINSQFRLDELTRYGELLTKYPILLEYLKLTEYPSASRGD
ncbi:MAG: hypothetical protein LBP37_07180 [Spirochaetaceae bacterium]|jgi:hypothetical protein|nr:hypothetical protein [Spirochaetaceae bacterium]